MKKLTVVIIAVALAAVLSAGTSFAHPPKDLGASWNEADNILTLTAKHAVNDPEKHYILSMTVYEGNSLLIQKQYSKQGSAEGFTDSVVLNDLASGTKLRVQMVCNIMGSAEMEFTIP